MTTADRTFLIPDPNLSRFQAEIARIAKRATKLGLDPIGFTVLGTELVAPNGGEAFVCAGVEVVDGVSQPIMIDKRVLHHRVEVYGPRPILDGWTLIAALDWIDGEVLIRKIDEVDVSTFLENAGCEHCNLARARKTTYVVRHEDGTMKQIGSTCLADFLRNPEAATIASILEFLAEAYRVAGEFEEMGGEGSGSSYVTLTDVLFTAARVIRACGFVSRRTAEERTILSTKDLVTTVLWGKGPHADKLRDEIGVEDDDAVTANATAAWIAIDPEEATTDYARNLAVLARIGWVPTKHLGLAVSAVASWRRSEEKRIVRERRAANHVPGHVGTVKKREVFTLTLVGATSWDGTYGTTYCYRFVDPEGRSVVWKASKVARFPEFVTLTFLDGRTGQTCGKEVVVGRTYQVRGTVKKHGNFKGEDQTEINRCVMEAEVADADADSDEPAHAAAAA